MNYKKIYFNIIRNRQQNPLPLDVYSENHHIIPRSFGGNDNPKNLVRLSAREHFIVHLLLVKIFRYRKNQINSDKQSECYKKMLAAFLMMSCNNKNQQRYLNFNGSSYENLRLENNCFRKKYDFNLVKSIFDFYVKNNLKPSDMEYINETFNINIKHRHLLHLFLKHNLSITKIKGFKRKYSEQTIKNMFNYYIENDCRKKKNYHLIEKEFGFNIDKKALINLFNENGFYISIKTGKSKKITKEELQIKYDFYIQNSCYKQENYHLFQKEFNYKSDRYSLEKIFKYHKLDVTKKMKNNHNKKYVKEIFIFYIQNKCNDDSNYHLIKEKFGYEYKNGALKKFFNKHGFYLSNPTL